MRYWEIAEAYLSGQQSTVMIYTPKNPNLVKNFKINNDDFLLGIDKFSDNEIYLFVMNSDQIIYSNLCIKKIENNIYQIVNIKSDEKGFGKILMSQIAKSGLNIRIINDTQQTESAQKMWEWLKQNQTIKIYNIKTEKVYDITDQSAKNPNTDTRNSKEQEWFWMLVC